MSAELDFPLVYCNGDSYSADTYHPSLKNNVYANIIAKQCNGFVINNAIIGCANRRIIRTTLCDMIRERQLNKTQKIIALIGLSFELRSEIWVDNIVNSIPTESNFRTHTFSGNTNWREELLTGRDIGTRNRFQLEQKFFDQYSKGRAYFFSPYAERINLLTDLIMLRSMLDSLNINFLVFQSPKAEKLESDYLLDFLKLQLSNDDRFFDLEEFGFIDWCHSQNFVPLDFKDRPNIGHYKADAHCAFAEKILIPRLKELKFL